MRRATADRERSVEPRGLEPLTPCLQSRCATNCAKAPVRDERAGVGQLLTGSVASAHRACSALDSSSLRLATKTPPTASRISTIFFTRVSSMGSGPDP